MAAFEDSIALLTGAGPHRVWSLLVSVFGDLAYEEGDWLTSMVLSQITAAIGVKPEAQRVALHRLRKDNWIQSRRIGRHSAHALTAFGREQSLAARPRIYSQPPQSCHILIVEPGGARPADLPGLAWITQDLAVSSVLIPGVSQCALPEPVPAWMSDRLCGAGVMADAEAMAGVLTAVLTLLRDGPHLPPVERAVLRVLVVHSWRRIVLKIPDLPDAVMPVKWRQLGCRRLSADVLALLERPDLTTLERACAAGNAGVAVG